MFKRARQQKGDTIVEVLIAIAIVSSVLGISYSAMNRNLLILRDNQERSEAVKLAQGQMETMKAMFVEGGANATRIHDLYFGDVVCFDGSNIIDITAPFDRAAFLADPSSQAVGVYPPECVKGLYRIAVTYYQTPSSATGPSEEMFHVHVTWDSLQRETKTVRMAYGVE